jgi:predicted amidohydrolase
MQHIAKEGRCFVISVNQFCKVSDFPSDYPPFTPDSHDRQPAGGPWTPDAVLSRGGSCVVGPLGTFVTEPVWDKEAIVYADLQMSDLLESRVGHSENCTTIGSDDSRWTSMLLDHTLDQTFCELTVLVHTSLS